MVNLSLGPGQPNRSHQLKLQDETRYLEKMTGKVKRICFVVICTGMLIGGAWYYKSEPQLGPYGPYNFVRSYRDNHDQRAFLFYATVPQYEKLSFEKLISAIKDVASERELNCVYVFSSKSKVPPSNFESAGVLPASAWDDIVIDYTYRKSLGSNGILRILRENGRQWIFLDDPSSEGEGLGLGGVRFEPEMAR